jgi:hypothetical protein
MPDLSAAGGSDAAGLGGVLRDVVAGRQPDAVVVGTYTDRLAARLAEKLAVIDGSRS